MRIHKIYLGELKVPLITPFKTALRTVYEANTILVAIESEDGIVGYGEAPPTAVITGDTKESIDAAIRYFIAPQIVGMSLDDWPLLMQKLHGAIVRNTSAKAAVDMALYDLKSKGIRKPLFEVLGGVNRDIQTDCTISINSPDEMVRDVQLAEAKGFEILKIKIGKNPEEDYRRLKAISQVIKSGTSLRLDANQGWTRDDAVSVIHRIEKLPLKIELIEQPVHALDFEGMKFVKDRISLPLLADESVFSPEDARRIIQMGAADLINIKLMKSGGLFKAIEINQLAEENGIACMIGCMLETTVGVSAAAHLAVAAQNITRADLDGPLLCSDVPTIGGAKFDGQWIKLDQSAGTGIEGLKSERVAKPLEVIDL